jgi:hypothetical protein
LAIEVASDLIYNRLDFDSEVADFLIIVYLFQLVLFLLGWLVLVAETFLDGEQTRFDRNFSESTADLGKEGQVFLNSVLDEVVVLVVLLGALEMFPDVLHENLMISVGEGVGLLCIQEVFEKKHRHLNSLRDYFGLLILE